MLVFFYKALPLSPEPALDRERAFEDLVNPRRRDGLTAGTALSLLPDLDLPLFPNGRLV